MDAEQRLLQERDNWRKDRPFGFVAKPVTRRDSSLNLFKWFCEFPGPEGSPWEKLTLCLNMVFYKTYPFSPPDVVFTSKIHHPNVYTDGYVCLDLLTTNWKPSLNIKTILLGVQNLISAPNLDSPANNAAGEDFIKGASIYTKAARNIFFSGISTKREVLNHYPN